MIKKFKIELFLYTIFFYVKIVAFHNNIWYIIMGMIKLNYNFYDEVLCKMLNEKEIEKLKKTNINLLFNNIFGEFRLNSSNELINVVTDKKYSIEKKNNIITITIKDSDYENDLIYARLDVNTLSFEFNYVKNYNDLIIKKINDYSEKSDSTIKEMINIFQYKNSVKYLKDKKLDIKKSIIFDNKNYGLSDLNPDGAKMIYRYNVSGIKDSYYSSLSLLTGESDNITNIRSLYDNSYDLLLGESEKYINNKSGFVLVKRY